MARFRTHVRDDAFHTIELHDDEARSVVEVAPARGGMVTRFAVDGDEVLYLDEDTLRDPTKNVRGGIPVLFPISGKVAGDVLHMDGRDFPMKQHGYARNRAWRGEAEVRSDEAIARCLLEEPAGAYPAAWTVVFEYVLSGPTLTLRQRYAHASDDERRIQPGFHPYFRVADATKKDARVVTDATIGRDNTNGDRVALTGPIDLTKKEVDLHLLDPKAKTTTLHRPGAHDLALDVADDFTVTVVWTLAGKDFVCVEPWSAPANALNEGGGLTVKPRIPYETWVRIRLL